MQNKNTSNIERIVLETIKNGRISMKPRWHFILKSTLVILGMLILLLTIVYLGSFVIFSLRESGVWFVPVFGTRGWYELLSALPLLLIGLSLVFVVIVEILVRRYSFGYRFPLLISLTGVFIIVGVGSILIAQTRFHRGLSSYMEQNGVPVAGSFYKNFGHPRRDRILAGKIIATSTSGFVLENRRGDEIKIITTEKTRYPLDTQFETGDSVVVLFEGGTSTIEAIGMRKIDSFEDLPTRHSFRKTFSPVMK